MKESNPIVVEQTYQVPTEKLWRAITDPDEMRQWFFEQMKDFRPEKGFRTEFIVENNGKIYPHVWKILEVVPGKKIKYDWTYRGYPGQGYVTFELTPGKNSTSLKLTNEGLETFPQDNPDFSRERCTAGWKCFLQDRLKKHLEK